MVKQLIVNLDNLDSFLYFLQQIGFDEYATVPLLDGLAEKVIYRARIYFGTMDDNRFVSGTYMCMVKGEFIYTIYGIFNNNEQGIAMLANVKNDMELDRGKIQRVSDIIINKWRKR